MGFKYLQTDDRDDYFDSISKTKRVKNNYKSLTLIDPSGVAVFEEVIKDKLRKYLREKYLSEGQSGRKVWRKELESRGYKVINNY
jgi:uncharacterized protein YnzC (UPF0291/DUF896 family)